MNQDKLIFNVNITKPCGEVVVIQTLAETKWEAEDRLHSRFIREQSDRSSYSAYQAKNVAKKNINKGVH